MKKYLLFTIILTFFLALLSCQKSYVVSFKPLLHNVIIKDQYVKPGEILKEPNIESQISYKYKLMGWYLNDEPFDFNTPINSNLTLTAKWFLILNTPKVIYTPSSENPIMEEYLTHVFIAKLGNAKRVIPSENKKLYPDPWVFSEYEFSDAVFIKGDLKENKVKFVGGWINDYIYQDYSSFGSPFEGNGYYLILTRWFEANESPTGKAGFLPVYHHHMSCHLPSEVYDATKPIAEQEKTIFHIRRFLSNYNP